PAGAGARPRRRRRRRAPRAGPRAAPPPRAGALLMLERAVFVIEPSGERVSCALNPNQLVFRRATGFVPRGSLAGACTSARAADDTLLFTGGAVTELVVDLLFDVSLP